MSTGGDRDPNTGLENAFDGAARGEPQAASNFFKAFLAGPLYVPDRRQQAAPKNLAVYPNDLVSVMALGVGDRTVVPAFSRPELIESWSNQPLCFTLLSGKELVARVPREWWIEVYSLNESSKDISPWEIEILSGEGEAGIAAIVEELSVSAGHSQPFEVSAVADSEYTGLRASLKDALGKLEAVKSAYLIRERAVDENGDEEQQLIIGLALEDAGGQRAAESAVRDCAAPLLIGDPFKVRAAAPDDSLLRGMFNQFQPFYTRTKGPSGFLRKLFGSRA